MNGHVLEINITISDKDKNYITILEFVSSLNSIFGQKYI